ncbi:MAG: hypothetical protein GF308_06505 [Candidatus Heimdallarchaeota archaeon]|nr:hypothetical protein [Candidatus Heimdallarchaeota archaeon]
MTSKKQRILEKTDSKEVIKSTRGANFFGLESKGNKQIRGNGNLFLTDKCLYFKMWVLKKEIIIPLSAIEKLETPKWHIGKSKFRPLLKIFFINKSGKKDSAAWLVKDLENWINVIKGMI